MLVDTHCHIQTSRFDEDREEVIDRALDRLDWLVVIGDSLESSEAALTCVRDGIYAAVGVHPYNAGTVDDAAIGRLKTLAEADGVVAIGEIGLDYFKYNETPRPVQRTALERQLALAAECDLPVVIHNRESTDDLRAVLDAHADKIPGGVLHCFAGTPEFAEHALSWGFHISFAGNVTFPKAEELREVAALVPADRLLVETDAPYLAPQAVRGKRCEPAYVAYTAEFLAELRGEDVETLCNATAENAARLFRLDKT